MKLLGDAIIAAGYTKKSFAEKFRLTTETIRHYEKGTIIPKLEMIIKIEKLVGPVDWKIDPNRRSPVDWKIDPNNRVDPNKIRARDLPPFEKIIRLAKLISLLLPALTDEEIAKLNSSIMNMRLIKLFDSLVPSLTDEQKEKINSLIK